ncbi:MAG: P-loop domain protein [Gemmatimonadetes bacterium]|nr:P-loop domain protein [Gemmatimonadota bacterium]
MGDKEGLDDGLSDSCISTRALPAPLNPQPEQAIPRAGFLLRSGAVATQVEDSYGHTGALVQRLVHLITDWRDEEGLVLGLFGPWGIGKSTLLNFLREALDTAIMKKSASGISVITFSPWLYENHAALTSYFFATLANGLNAPDTKIWKDASNSLRTMGKFLAAAASGVTVLGLNVDVAKALSAVAAVSEKTGEGIDSATTGEQTLQRAREDLEAALRQGGNDGAKVVILIDDLDRLAPEELLIMLKLIRLAGDLPYITVIVALDERKVRGMLDARGVGYGAQYLEKIIPLGMSVPYPDPEAMRHRIVLDITATLCGRGLEPPEWLQNNSQAWSIPGKLRLLSRAIVIPRDLTRFVNSLRVLLLTVDDDLDLNAEDAIFVEVLHVFYPNAYNRVRAEKAFLTGQVSNGRSMVDENYAKRERAKRLEELLGKSDTGEFDELIGECLTILFGDLSSATRAGDTKFAEAQAERRVRVPQYFGRYFGMPRDATGISFREISEITEALRTSGAAADESRILGLMEGFAARDEPERLQFLQDLRVRLYNIDLSAAVVFGSAALRFATTSRGNYSYGLLNVAVARIVGSRDHVFFDTPERTEAFATIANQVMVSLPLRDGMSFLDAFDLDYRSPSVTVGARNTWLLRYDLALAKDRDELQATPDDHAPGEVDLWGRVAMQFLMVSPTSENEQHFPHVRDALVAWVCESPQHLWALAEIASQAAKRWRENAPRAHIARLRKAFGETATQQMVTCSQNLTIPGIDTENFFAALLGWQG